MNDIRGSKPPTNKTVYLHFRCLNSELNEKQPGTSSLRNSAKIAVENEKQLWLHYRTKGGGHCAMAPPPPQTLKMKNGRAFGTPHKVDL